MRHILPAIIRADVGEDEIPIAIEGCVTDQRQHSLHAITRRTRQLDMEAPVVLDLQQTQHCVASTVDLLRRTVDDLDPRHRGMQNLPSDPLPICPLLGRADTARATL
jgi:anti-anti-sigma regulatory factor